MNIRFSTFLSIIGYFVAGYLLKLFYFWKDPIKGSDTFNDIFATEVLAYSITTAFLIGLNRKEDSNTTLSAALYAIVIITGITTLVVINNTLDCNAMIIIWNIVNVGCIFVANTFK